MGHEIILESDNVAPVMLANKPAWHGLGTVLPHCPTSREAITVARMNWQTMLLPIQSCNGVEIPGSYATWRGDLLDKSSGYLGTVSDRYQVIQNIESFELLDSLVENGEMRYESCGSLHGGKQIWLLGRLPSVDTIAEGDDNLRYVLFLNGHDGKTPFTMIPTAVRVVCANTKALALSIAKNSGLGMTFHHKGDMDDKLNQMREYMQQFDDLFVDYRDNARLLAERKITIDQAKQYVAKLFPIETELQGRGLTIMENRIESVRNAFRFGRNQLASIKGTWYQLYNAITDSVDHDQRKTFDTIAKRERQFANLLTGDASEFKNRAFALALEMSA